VDILISGGSSEAFAYRISFAVAGVITSVGLLFLGILLYRTRRTITKKTAPMQPQ
jgi:HAMP domain-containing protein